ncbi:4'-phosphopantetheinyl transferase superfamily protein [Acuticoccus sp. M5D2P5]|uniref:4'-phosphopantetheinyl transferase family protein n=1 Tax=Acuticoccus kalidii TaxID=2910977 RepID=UPI001F2D8344|nr:4'-phosphopantetheinyl transferase superfamily protein [Acuticoccus kalidii]MCF3932400.1 4'-phosphopantetheinyl transferase superfamily protein [Acuticoccus kalidii]
MSPTVDPANDGEPADERVVRVWIWRLDLTVYDGKDDTVSPEDEALLDPAERRKADGFVFPRDRRRYVVAHAAVRRILGGCLGVAPKALTFTLGTYGKPYLVRRAGQADLRFSLSHTSEYAALGVTEGADIGLDIEAVRPVERALATRFFAHEEVRFLDTHLGPGGRMSDPWQNAFFRVWTAKEAVIKALGRGLSMPLDGFAVGLEPAPHLIRLDEAPESAGAWQIEPLTVPPEIMGSIALPSRGWTVRYETLPPAG